MRSLSLLVPVLGSLAIAGCTTSPDEVPVAEPSAVTFDTSSKPAPDLCTSLAAKATELLAAAQRCNVAAANPTQCASWVPSIDGCEQPVAYAGSSETSAYLKAFDLYAQSCPLPDRPCVDPGTLAVDCTQDPAVDSLVGACAILGQP